VTETGTAPRSILAAFAESRANYWAAYATDFSCPFLFAYLGHRSHLTWPVVLFSFIAGCLVFSLIEYAIHRWLLHNPKTLFYPLHEAHHRRPEDTSAFLFPTSIVVLGLVWLLFVPLLHWNASSFFISGIAAGYLSFGTLHHFEHTTRINQIPFRWLQHRWAAHSVHHHLDETNYGVLTSFWDYVFGTNYKQIKRRSRAA
jgi:cyclopropane-fatty-acyl-phospholipid synthase